MKKDTTDFVRLQSLRREVREAWASGGEAATLRQKRPGKRLAVYVEDLIVGRLILAEADLAVAAGLFRELAHDKESPFLRYGSRLSEALDIVQDTLYLRNPGLYGGSK